MLIENLPAHLPEAIEQLNTHKGLVIACYCADWCGTCKSYQTEFANLSQRFPQHLFLWIDIEESPDLLDDFDVENFPTLLIQEQGHNHFFGTMLPHIQHLERLILSAQDNHSSTHQEGPSDLRSLMSLST